MTTGFFWLAEWQFITLGVIAATAVVYLRGWIAYHQSPPQPLAAPYSKYQKRLFFIGLTLALIILASPVHLLATKLFSIRVAQHILLMALIPCLVTFSNPIPILISGLPQTVRQRLKQLFQFPHFETNKKRLVQLTSPGNMFILATISFWIWYDPAIHQLTLKYQWLHTFETSWLFIVALLFWWHIMGAFPQVHTPLPPIIRIIYTIIGTWPIKIVGLILMFSSQALYAYPQSFQLSGLNINDQGIGAILVWSLGGIVFSTTAAFLARDWLQNEAEKPVNPAPPWRSDRGMRAPGFPKI